MRDFTSEIKYKTSRSSGAGGQNVNKVETSVMVAWNISESHYFNEEEKELIYRKLKNRINSEGFLQITCSESRTQFQNKKIATEKMLEIVAQSLIIPKKRKATKPTKSSQEKRLQQKKQHSDKKENRKFKI